MFARYPPLYQGCAETMRSVARNNQSARVGSLEIELVEGVGRFFPLAADSGGVARKVLLGAKIDPSWMVIPDILELRQIRLGEHLRLGMLGLEATLPVSV
jgi:hypothetical protein